MTPPAIDLVKGLLTAIGEVFLAAIFKSAFAHRNLEVGNYSHYSENTNIPALHMNTLQNTEVEQRWL